MGRATRNVAAELANEHMVDRLIAQGALWSPRLMEAFRATPRHCFLDRIYQSQRRDQAWHEVVTTEPGPAELRLIYSDRALITHLGSSDLGAADTPVSSSSQPSLMAQMLEDLRLAPGLRVLEIGAGTGYNAALMAYVTGPDCVWSVDVDRNILIEAWSHLRAFPERQVRLEHADGRMGLPALAPFDRIIVTASTKDLERSWLEQLAEGGILLVPLALAPGMAYLLRGTMKAATFEGKLTRPAYFMRLRDEDECEPGEEPVLDVVDSMERHPAPWSDWLGQSRRFAWPGFTQSLAFLARLRGLDVDYRILPDKQYAFGIGDSAGHATCWLGPTSWYVNDRRGLELGRSLWRAFLEAGGPWPTEWRCRITLGEDRNGTRHEPYRLPGLDLAQHWELDVDRHREIAPW